MKQVFIRNGKAEVADVPVPLVEPGTVLVAVLYSCISSGTEISGVKNSGEPLLLRAMKHPEEVRQALKMAADQGARRIYTLVRNKISSGTIVGYSAAGQVIEVGEGIEDIRVGDYVACAGAQCAHHAQVIRVPRNLFAPVPQGVGLNAAATVTLGAIALQGVRRCQVTLGETIVVVGLGTLGLLMVQLLGASGARVIAIDLDRSKVECAREFGALAFHPEDQGTIDHVHRLTDGYGADAVIVAAASSSNAIIADAFRMCRKKARVVLVGDVGLQLNRDDFYKKELDFLISSSYGPGRYDASYEEGGIDYPIAYVRWTENRNLAEYLKLIRDGRVNVDRLICRTTPVEEAAAAYEAIQTGDSTLVSLLKYPPTTVQELSRHCVRLTQRDAGAGAEVRLGIVGPGSFAKGMHLPNLQSMNGLLSLRSVMSRTAHNALSVAKQFHAGLATTSLEEFLADAELDAVLIASRHDLHASTVISALRAGKHVYVEKPLSLTQAGLDAITAFYAERTAAPLLMTGFNRRFSPHVRAIAPIIASRSNPMIINYRMNAGHIPLDHWVHGPEGGGRNLGEACHVYDLFTFLTGSAVKSVTASSIKPTTAYYGTRDNFVASMTFADGSVASLTYSALGSKDYAKELMEIHVDGKVIVLDDYRSVKIVGARLKGSSSRLVEKGHREALRAFAQAIKHDGEFPIPLWQQVQATQIALNVEAQLGR